MRFQTVILTIAMTTGVAACHHDRQPATMRSPDFSSHAPRAKLSRVPASPAHKAISPTGWVFFAFDSAVLTPEGQQDLDAAAEWLRSHPSEKVLIAGHTDVTGPADYNLELSFKRGVAVADFLVARGVARDRMEIEPQGERGATVGANTTDRRAIIYATAPRSE